MRNSNRLGFPVWLPLLLGVMLFWVAQQLAAATHHVRRHTPVPVHKISYHLINT